MNRKTVWIALLALASIPAFGQATTDRNLKATRTRSDVTTAPPPRVHTGHTDSAAQLDKLERQTSRIVAQPAAKQQTAPVYKTPSDHERPTGTAYQQNMPLHAHHNGTSASAARPAKPVSPHPYSH